MVGCSGGLLVGSSNESSTRNGKALRCVPGRVHLTCLLASARPDRGPPLVTVLNRLMLITLSSPCALVALPSGLEFEHLRPSGP
jgi:hypothetical protein